jgi:hypothetical protein
MSVISAPAITCEQCSIFPESYFLLTCEHKFCTGCITFQLFRNPGYLTDCQLPCIKCKGENLISSKLKEFFERSLSANPPSYEEEQVYLDQHAKKIGVASREEIPRFEEDEKEFGALCSRFVSCIEFKKNMVNSIYPSESDAKFEDSIYEFENKLLIPVLTIHPKISTQELTPVYEDENFNMNGAEPYVYNEFMDYTKKCLYDGISNEQFFLNPDEFIGADNSLEEPKNETDT